MQSEKHINIARGFGSFAFTLLLYLGLPLLGWGPSDLAGFFSLPQRLGYAFLIILIGSVVFYHSARSPEGIRGSRGQRGKLVTRQSIIRIAITALLLVGLVFIPFTDRHSIGVMPDTHMIRWLGFIIFVLGIGLVLWSGLVLGRYYSPEVTLQEDHRLIMDGPYRCIRHPRYLGGIALGFGLSLLFRSWIGLILTVFSVPIFLFRIRDEEAFMRSEFGHEWEEYCNRSWRLIPRLY